MSTQNRPSKRWVFTLNNYTEEQTTTLNESLDNGETIKYAVYGFEVGDSGTPHLQGFVIFKHGKRFNECKRALGDTVHIERALGTSQQARDYCQKDGNYKEFGTFPGSSGERNDLAALVTWADRFAEDNGRPATVADIVEHQPNAFVKYSRFAELCRLRFKPKPVESDVPNDWQRELQEELLGPADDRTVKFFVDREGEKGKSWFCRWFMINHHDVTQVFTGGTVADIAYAVDESKKVFLFNMARNGMQFLQYRILEALKDRMVFSPKYMSVTKFFHHKNHVVVFCNEDPDMSMMTADRYDIKYLE
ncbi:MAG: putative viral replication protein [Eurynomevirus troutis]|uniref:Viral replication protein n=1 Tax=Cressdnaviricota sp. TaxID=2748378 RepID=A0A345MXX8_9VIRU|nr:MAG: putative viral replication protein [Cressdnaviricota sp.]